MRKPTRTVVLASGSGSNFQAFIDDNGGPGRLLDICGLVCDNAAAYALQRAQQADIPATVVAFDKLKPRSDFDTALATAVDDYAPELVILAGFMKIIAGPLLTRYAGRLLNIHPALLPKFKGLNTHQRCLDARDIAHGSTVHFVTAGLDDGPAILQASLVVAPDDTAATLSARVQAMEHKIYPMAARWVAEGRAMFENNQAILDGIALTAPVVVTEEELMT